MRWSLGRISLRAEVLSILGLILLISALGGSLTIYSHHRMLHLLDAVAVDEFARIEAVHRLESALLQQKGYATYYYFDGDPAWLEQLSDRQRSFRAALVHFQQLELSPSAAALAAQITRDAAAYDAAKARVIALYRAGDRVQGAAQHRAVREQFDALYGLCERLEDEIEAGVPEARQRALFRARGYSALASTALFATLTLGMVLALVILHRLIQPLHRLALAATGATAPASGREDLRLLTRRIAGLMQDMDHAQSELERSKAMLLQSEKMAVMGKLAADVAHSIRTPITSIKMRLFSLARLPDLSAGSREDLETVSEEIRRLDNIVSRFLEFSRPPSLKMEKVDLSRLVEASLHLLRGKLDQEGIELLHDRCQPLHHLFGDPELLQEVLVNLLVNACEAMPQGGKLTVTEAVLANGDGRRAMVRVEDSGPGVPEPLREKIFQPFFSTKEFGTGLGLAVAKTIVREHGGELVLADSDGGAAFEMRLPLGEE